MTTRTLRLFILFTFVLATFGAPFFYQRASESFAAEGPVSTSQPAADALGGCKRHTPEDGATTCCISGWVYENGQPVAAEVEMVSPTGSLTVFAQPHDGTGTDPYYTVNLSDAPLSVAVGDTLDLTARYNGKERSLTYTVQVTGQQVDMVLPLDTEPADNDAPPRATIAYALEQSSGAAALHGIGQEAVRGRTIAAYRWMDGSGAVLGQAATLTLPAAHLPPTVRFQVQDSAGQWSNIDTLVAGGAAHPTDKIVFTSTRDGNNEIYVMDADGTNVTRLTTNPAYDVGPVWSPDGSKIAFVSDRDGDEEIYVMNADGSNQTRLTTSPGADWIGSWSPDGNNIVFESHRDGNEEIYVMDADGANPVNLTNHSASDWNPSWSPDGESIVFVSGRSGNADIYTMNANGTGTLTNLTNTTGESEWLPEWSPDGEQIAFVSTINGNGDIAIMNADGTGRMILTTHSADDEKPAWSSDGTRIVFMSNRDGQYEIYMIHADGSGLMNVTDDPAEDWKADWLPAATPPAGKIVFSSDRDGNNEIYVMDTDGTNVTRLTTNNATDEQPSWSPDGSKIAFVSDRDGNLEIYVMNADGSGQTRLTNNPTEDYWPDWSPDGTRIAFDSARDGGWDIYTMNPDGTAQTRLTYNVEGNGGAAWSPDGARIAFHCRQNNNLDICAMNADGSGQVRLTTTLADEWLPAWSPDGTRLAFESYRDGVDNSEIYLMDVDGSNQTRLTANAGWDGLPTWTDDGQYILFSSDRNGDTDIYAMGPDGQGVMNITNHPGTDQKPDWLPAATPPTINTLLLTNRQRLASVSSDAEADQVLAKLDALANHTRVNGLLIAVEEDPAVAAAYAAWNDPTSATQANAVTTAIKQVIEGHLNAHPDIAYLVIAGDDRVIPFRRTADLTYYPDPNTLTDDFYTDRVPTSTNGHELYIPDLASGRLVETPAQIMAQIDTFLANDGITLNTGISVGYDFVQDGARAHCNAMQADGLTTNCSLISESWSATDYLSSVLIDGYDLVSSNVHANYNIYGTPQGFVSASDFRNSTLDLSRSLFYSVGCHSGQNVSTALDLPEAIAGDKTASYVANTGFGWGGVGVILSEELMWRFTQHVLAGNDMTPGDALVQAKQHYYADHANPDPYDEKITTESTLYGLPMYQVTSPGTALAAASSVTTARTDAQLTADVSTVSRDHAIRLPQPIDTDDGRIYVLPDGIVSSGHREPVQPGFTEDVALDGTRAHGAVFMGGSYVVETIDPVIQDVLTTSVKLAAAEPQFTAPGWYPARFIDLNRVTLEGETLERTVSTVGQHNPNLATDNQRIFTQMSIDTFYSDNTDDWEGPATRLTQNTLSGSLAQITVEADDPAGIYTVVVAYTDGSGTWSSTVLGAGSGSEWSGSFPATAETGFFIQAVDGVGNVTYRDANGRYFAAGAGTDPDPGTVDLTGYAHEFFAEPAIAWAGEETDIWFRVHRTGGKTTLADTTVRFLLDHVATGTELGTSTTPPLAPPHSADNTSPLGVTFAEPGEYTLFAVIDPNNDIAEADETNNVIERTIIVLPPRDRPDQKAPVITDMRINGGAPETSVRPITIDIRATDQQPDPSGVKGVYLVEYEWYPDSGQWVPTHVSDEWLDYTTTPESYAWELEPAAGMRYIYGWAIDEANNISISHGSALVNYQPARDSIAQDETRVYRHQVAQGEHLEVTLEVLGGDADLYIWSPNESASAWVSNLAEGNDQVIIPSSATTSGTYQIEVFGFSDADYRLQVHTTASAAQQSVAQEAVGGIATDKTTPAAPVVAVSSVPEGNLWNAPAPPISATPEAEQTLYLPLVVR
jgi:Tol biopolymer transport system component